MYRLLALLLACTLAAPVAAQGERFPVFGPSAEREAFFENKRNEEEARVAALRAAEAEARRLRELEARLAAAEAALAYRERPYAGYVRHPYRRCTRIVRDNTATFRPGQVTLGTPRQATNSRPETRIVCYPRFGRKYLGDRLYIDVDDGDVTARGRIRRPGLDIRIDID